MSGRIYTAAYKDRQKQHIAFSNDRGRTWTNYTGNPVVDLDAPDFRDPKVFWYEPQHKWVMVSVLADERTLVIFDSPDLKQWTVLSHFRTGRRHRRTVGVSRPNRTASRGEQEKKWVLIINRNPGAPAGGTGVRYVVGKFDGKQFTSVLFPRDKIVGRLRERLYATNSFNDMPLSDHRKIWMGWTSNWLYAKDEPTVSWRGAHSIPRTLTLRRTAQRTILVQTPVRELESLRGQPFQVGRFDHGCKSQARTGQRKGRDLRN